MGDLEYTVVREAGDLAMAPALETSSATGGDRLFLTFLEPWLVSVKHQSSTTYMRKCFTMFHHTGTPGLLLWDHKSVPAVVR